jgi:cob(I)alamin adenosyltransferase
MKIYTKKGDRGQTSLIGGTKVPKSDLRIECYGTVDELNSYLGLIVSMIPARSRGRVVLNRIQERLFVVGSLLANDHRVSRMTLPQLKEADVLFLEQEIDLMTAKLSELKSFILPGGSPAASWCHVARCVCRRAERAVVALSMKDKVDPRVIVYLNRLSDYLFVLARAINQSQKVTDIPWKPKR